MRGKFSIFSAELTITGRPGERPKLRGSLEMRVGSLRGRERELVERGLAALDARRRAVGMRPQPEIEEMARELGRAPAAPPAMPHSRREVFEQREASQRGMQQKLRNALALDTIEAFYDDTGTGKIQRLDGTGDPERPPCQACGVRPALPMDPGDAAFVRAAFRKARMPPAMAYAFAATRVIVTQKNRHRLCSCDVVAWDVAIGTFQKMGRGVWRRFGLDP